MKITQKVKPYKSHLGETVSSWAKHLESMINENKERKLYGSPKHKALKKSKDNGIYDQKKHQWIREPRWMKESGKRQSKAFGALIKKNNNWENKDSLD